MKMILCSLSRLNWLTIFTISKNLELFSAKLFAAAEWRPTEHGMAPVFTIDSCAKPLRTLRRKSSWSREAWYPVSRVVYSLTLPNGEWPARFTQQAANLYPSLSRSAPTSNAFAPLWSRHYHFQILRHRPQRDTMSQKSKLLPLQKFSSIHSLSLETKTRKSLSSLV